MDYRSRWQQRRRERVTRQRLIIIIVALAAAVAVVVSWQGMAWRAPAAFTIPGPDVTWLTPGPDFLLVCGRSGRLARVAPGLPSAGSPWARDFTHPAGFLGRPAVTPDLALLPCADLRLRAVELSTGQQAWEIQVGGAVTSVTADGNTVFFGSEDGSLYAANTKGELLWQRPLGARVVAEPLVTDEHVIAATLEGSIHCLARGDGRELWRVQTVTGAPIYAGPRMGPSTILVGDDGGMLHSITPEGEVVASLELAGLVRGPVGVSGGIVVVGDSSGLLVRIHASDMAEIWRAHLPGPVATAPVIVGDTVWCGAGSSLIALTAGRGRVIRRLRAAADTSDLVAAFGRMFWATTDGRVLRVNP
ncbi:MAG: PQQ-binding-like beta-propeller repeat protein [Armatimonadota bacterium]